MELNRRVLDHYWRGIAHVMTAIATAPAGRVPFHCSAGKDRTGLIAALLLALAGVPTLTIAEDYALSQTCLQPITDQRLNQEPNLVQRARLAEMLSVVPQTMVGTLKHLNTRHGGVERYLLAAGESPADVERLHRCVKE